MQAPKFPIENFSARFSRLIAATPLSQKELAMVLDVAESAIVNYKKGRTPKADELLRIAQCFRVSIEWLLTGREPKYSSVAIWKDGFFLAYGWREVESGNEAAQPTIAPPIEFRVKFEFDRPEEQGSLVVALRNQKKTYERFKSADEEGKRAILSIGDLYAQNFTSRTLAAIETLMKKHLKRYGSLDDPDPES